ncbi:MAG: hypothetical protein ACXWF8_10800 [Methylobacter sp.]
MLSFKLTHIDLARGLTVVFLLLGVSTASVAQPLEASADSVQDCQYVDDIEASSGYGKKPDWQSLAKYSALAQAEKLGASHVVWGRFTNIGAFNGIVTGKAYKCNS